MMGLRGGAYGAIDIYIACDERSCRREFGPTCFDPVGIMVAARDAGWLVGTFTGQTFCPDCRKLNENLSSVEFTLGQLHDDMFPLPLHRTEATWPRESCSTCSGGGCWDCTERADS